MADIRINALATTAASTASDDFIAVDGSANGTRKLNAYSPTFGGNLTVSGVTTSGGISNSGALTFTAAIGQVAGSIAKNATYGLTYFGVTGSSNDNTMLNASGAVVLSNPAGTTNTTLAGNLTVSGNTANFGGADSSPTINFKAADTGSVTLNFGGTTNPDKGRILYTDNSDAFLFYTADTERMRLTSGGNFLLGTSTDSANGKLQLATHTTSAGGIGFGTDTSLYRSGIGDLAIGTTTSYGTFRVYNGATQYGYLQFSSSSGDLNQISGSLYLKTGGNAALTLDSSQNATFAGQASVNNGSLLVYYNTGSARISPSLVADVSSTATTNSGLPPALLIRNRGTSTQNQWARIGFAAGSSAIGATDGIIGAEIAAQFVGAITGNSRSTDIVFGTADQTVSQEPVERMRIKYNGRINFASLPTSSAGLAAGDIWNDSGTLKIV